MFAAFLLDVHRFNKIERIRTSYDMIWLKSVHLAPYLVSNIHMYTTRFNNIYGIIRVTNLEDIVVSIHRFRLHVLAHLENYLLVEITKHSLIFKALLVS